MSIHYSVLGISNYKIGVVMKKNVNVLMALDLKKSLDKDAKKNHRSVGKHINFIIEKHLKGEANAS